jgi:hypothetical protein
VKSLLARVIEHERGLEREGEEFERLQRELADQHPETPPRRLKALNRLREVLGQTSFDAWTAAIGEQQRLDRRAETEVLLEELRRKHRAGEWLLGRIESRPKDGHKEFIAQLRDILNTVASRFHFAGDLWPLELKPIEPSGDGERRVLEIVGEDGRSLAMLSTGQRGQLAVSFMVAQNLALGSELGHRILLLDDVTTSYDLTNIARECIVWRQLAYGAKDGRQRRQIFLCSHHEDLTNHIIDHLVPPRGRTMTVVRFDGWSMKDGPQLTSYDVDPAQSVGGSECDDGESTGESLAEQLRREIVEVLR